MAASSSGTTYQWQVNTGAGFTDLTNNTNYTGTNAATLHLSHIPSLWNGYTYRCLVDGVVAGFFKLNFTNEWTGTTSTAWELGSNWSCGVVPDTNTNVVITSGNIVISSNVTIRTLSLAPGVTLTVSSGYTLTVTH
jgi:hypothetical protein